jgi:hypothetical protein
MRATWLADVLADAGLKVKPYTGWETRGIDDFAPRGVMLHHTVTKPTTSDAVVDRLLAITGSSKVKAPLCNYSTNRDGSVSIIAAGTANHGGVGRWNGVSGNRYWFGDEMKNLGTSAEPWAPIQVESALRAAAAVLTHIGADASWMCGHKEYATPAGRKVDPHSLNMNSLRTVVAELQEDDMKPPAWATEATQWHIDTRIYSETSTDQVDESEEFHRQTVFRHRMWTRVIAPAIGSGSGAHTHEATVRLT